MRNLATLNQLWDGNSLTIDRKSSESFTVRGARLTVALQVQEPTLRSFFDKSGALARGTGFLARFLVAWPESTQGFRPFTEAPENWPALATFNRRISAILNQPVPMDDDGALIPPMLPLSPEAKAAWISYHDAIESELASGGDCTTFATSPANQPTTRQGWRRCSKYLKAGRCHWCRCV
jgi:putative DNA primase/helicase